MTIANEFGLLIEDETKLESTEPVVPEQKTFKKTPEMERIDPIELEYAYVKHPIVFNAINKATQAIMTAGWELKSKDQKTREYFESFINQIGKVGENVTFEEILESIFKYQLIYGNAYLELVPGKYTGNFDNIVDIVILDPKRIDYAKKSDGQIALDNFNKPIGYVQKLPYSIDAAGKGDKIPEGSNISLGSNEIFLMPERICHFKLHTYGDRFYGQGIIEPAYKSILYEMMLKKSHANSMEQKGEGIVIDYVGSTFHEPTPQMIQNAVENMKNFKTNRYFAFPYWHKIDPLELKPAENIIDSLKYLREDIAASLGMPLAFITGSGEATNRSTLATQYLFLTVTLNDAVKRTLDTLKKYIFERISSFHKFSEVPELAWGHIGVEEINEKSDRLVKYAQAGMLDPDAAKDYILKSERLDIK